MIWPLLKLDLRKSLPWYLAALVALIGFLLAGPVLDSANVAALTLGMVQGWLLAWCIFREPDQADAFLFSRPFTRQRVFWNRWALAMVLQAVTVLLVYAILAAGTRTWLHQHHLPYYPMVAPFELAVLWPVTLASVISFHVVMFLMVHSRVFQADAGAKWKRYGVKLAFVLILMVFAGGSPAAVHGAGGGGDATATVGRWAILYAAVLIVLGTAASLDGYKNMEIDK